MGYKTKMRKILNVVSSLIYFVLEKKRKKGIFTSIKRQKMGCKPKQVITSENVVSVFDFSFYRKKDIFVFF